MLCAFAVHDIYTAVCVQQSLREKRNIQGEKTHYSH